MNAGNLTGQQRAAEHRKAAVVAQRIRHAQEAYMDGAITRDEAAQEMLDAIGRWQVSPVGDRDLMIDGSQQAAAA